MALNVNRNVDDPFYRYKMPRLLAKVEGKGNGIKTVIANMPEIAKALSRPPTYPTKYFGCELGAQTQFDLKNDRYIVNGEHDAGKLQDLLDGFIKKYVLCQGCDNPETTLTVNVKKNLITQACKACGYTGTISGKSRLITFVCKNPPSSPEEGAAPDSSGKKKGRGSPTEDPKEEVGLKVAEEEIQGQTNGQEPEGQDVEDEDDWDPDPDEFDAPDAPEITAGIASMVFHPDMEKPVEERLDMFYNFFTKALKDAGGDANKLSNKAVVAESDRLDIKEKAPLLMARSLFTNDVLKEIPKFKSLLLQFTEGNKRAQKYLLGGLEQLVSGEHKEALMPRVALILKALYDEDIVTEETLLDWGKKSSKKYVSRGDNQKILENAGPFLKWLAEADEEETSEEEEDDDEKGVVFEEEGRGLKAPIKPVQNGITQNGQESINGKHEEHDDLDIDDI